MKASFLPGQHSVSWLALWLCLLASPSLAQVYSVTDLGTLPGDSFSAATGINSFGQVVGYGSHAFLWTKAHGMQDLGTLCTCGPSWASAINDVGHVTGGSWIDESDNGAFLWTPEESMQQIVFVGDGQGGLAMNDFDKVGGSTSVEPPEPFLWTKTGGEVNLGPMLGSVEGVVSGVNDRGQTVGFYIPVDSTQAYLWSQKSGLEDLGQGFANAINFEGKVVGSNSANHAFLWTRQAGMKDLGTLPGDQVSSAAAINFFGEVVGTSGSRAFLWSPYAGMLDLNTLIPPGSGWTLSSATGINISGQIVGNGTINGQQHAFLLTWNGLAVSRKRPTPAH
jgi:probable HAF family extracellular repeat protein